MKLKEGVILQEVCGEGMLVMPDSDTVIRSNPVAHFIFSLLQEETTEEAVVAAVCERYNAPREVIVADVHDIIVEAKEKGFVV
ncbi:MAG: PqqD family protein [Bacteroidaceae bacterium]|nr:PqqD family protein [Bacteroidaceae bacterium]